jgi:hypothetical protein
MNIDLNTDISNSTLDCTKDSEFPESQDSENQCPTSHNISQKNSRLPAGISSGSIIRQDLIQLLERNWQKLKTHGLYAQEGG